MTDAKRTLSMKLATTICLVLLLVAVRSTGALQKSAANDQPDLAANNKTRLDGSIIDTDPFSSTNGQVNPQAATPQQTSTPTHSTFPTSAVPMTGTGNPSTPNSGGTSGGGGAGTAPTPPPATYKFRNGSYQAVGSYSTITGSQSINVTLVVADDIVIDSNVSGNATTQPSTTYQQDFIANYKQYVVGKKLDVLNLTKVSGSSLTPQGFNSATNNIEVQARI